MTFRLPIVIAPDIREGLDGFVRRLACANGVPPMAIFRWIGRPRTPIETRISRLRSLTGLEGRFENEFAIFSRPNAKLRWMPQAFEFLGVPIRPAYIIPSGRICPICISENAQMKELWNLRYATACIKHGINLVDTCECGRSLATLFRRRQAWSCFCGTHWSSISTKPACTPTIEISRWIAAKFGEIEPREVNCPAPWASADGLDLISGIDTIGYAALVPEYEDELLPDAASRPVRRYAGGSKSIRVIGDPAEIVRAAYPVIKNWPDAFHDLIAPIACRNSNAWERGQAWRKGPTVRHIFATRIGRLVRSPPVDINGRPNPIILDEVKIYINKKHGFNLRNDEIRSNNKVRIAGRLGSYLEAHRQTGGAKGNDLRIAYTTAVSSIDDQNISDEHLGKLIIEKTVTACLASRQLIGPYTASRMLRGEGGSKCLQPWIDAGLLSETNGEKSLISRESHFLITDVERVLSKLNEISIKTCNNLENFILFNELRRNFFSSQYNKSEIISDIFAERLVIYTKSLQPRLCDILLSREILEVIPILCSIRYAVKFDTFVFASNIVHLVDKIWKNPLAVSKPWFAEKRKAGAIRFKKFRHIDRQSSYYKFSMVDELERQFAACQTTRWEFLDEKLALIFPLSQA